MISVCVATYNGEKYIEEQLNSILKQLSEYDEVVISDDGSTDHTIPIIKELQLRYPNIRLLNGPKKGVIKNFETAIADAKGDIIFLSDQDDIWMDNKVEEVLPLFDDPHHLVVVHDAIIVDADANELEPSLYMRRNSKSGLIKNLAKNSYVGCCMAFRSSMRNVVLPFPENIEMHDWWIGLLSEMKRGSVFIADKLIKYRRHGENVSSFHHYSIGKMIRNRVYFILQLSKVYMEDLK